MRGQKLDGGKVPLATNEFRVNSRETIPSIGRKR